jgi:uncharacterized HAD superfamily protein
MIIGFDKDGVIAKAPLGLHNLLKVFQRTWNLFLKTWLGELAYKKLRFANKDVKDLICQLYIKGHKIIIITYITKDNSKKVADWLVKNDIPFDQIITPTEKENPLEFKIRAVLKTNCDFYIEDQKSLVKGISSKAPEVKIIHYKKEKDLDRLKKELR